MTIIETKPDEFDALFAASCIRFNTAAFAVLNQARCEELRFLLFVDNKTRMGLIIARRENRWYSPFSAPFGGFVTKANQPSIETVEQAIKALIDYLKLLSAESFRLTLPPLFYDSNLLTKIQHACTNQGFVVTDWDLNYHFPTDHFNATYVTTRMNRNARRNWKASCEFDLEFSHIPEEKGLRRAYALILENRKYKGYYLSMSLEAMLNTSQVISVDSFLVSKDGSDLASAIVFHTAPGIVQVIYWGDLPESKPFSTMHFLAYRLFGFYKELGIQMVDVGPAMIDNKPNYGLCEFKESIGCDIQPKLTLEWKP